MPIHAPKQARQGRVSGVQTMTRKSYPREAGFGEMLGLAFGGAFIVAVISAQVLFVAWLI